MNKDTKFYIFDIIPNRAGRYGAYDEVRMVDEQCNLYLTYVDYGHRNRAHWRQIVLNPDSGFIIHNCRLKGKQRVLTGDMLGAWIINGDSRPEIDLETTGGDVRQHIVENIIPNLKSEPVVKNNSPFEYR